MPTVKVRINPQSYKDMMNTASIDPSPFRPGLTATVDIRTNHVHGVAVPIQSVTTRDEKKPANGKPQDQSDNSDDSQVKMNAPVKEYVFVFKAGKIKQVQVTTGIQDDTYIQVLTGIKAGDEVVSAPYSAISKTLKDNMDVQKVDKSKLFSADNSGNN